MTVNREFDEEITLLHKAGKQPIVIATMLDLSEGDVFLALQRLGLQKNPKTPGGLSQGEMATICEHYKNEKNSIKNICTSFGITPDILYAVLEKSGVPLRVSNKKKSSVEALERAIDLYVNTEMPVYRIYIETGVAISALMLALHKRGIPTRTQIKQKAEEAALNKRVNEYYSSVGKEQAND